MSDPAPLATTDDDVELARAALARAPLPKWAKRMVSLLDDGFRIPGTRIGIGLDPILGAFLPVAGDAITGVGSASLLLLALEQRVPAVVLLRMVMNVGIDTVVGSVPFVGDLFDAFWRSNRKNLDLIEEHRGEDRDPSATDYALVGVGLLLVVLSIVLPILGMLLLGASFVGLIQHLFGG